MFVAYDQPDKERAQRLVHALEASGFAVWSHADLTSGENWHSEIEAALEAASCVIVLWSRSSVGPGGEFVRDEARRALERGVLLPVLLHRVDPPLGFREIQAIDLSRWRSSRSNPSFRDLCAAIQARIDGRDLPAPRATRTGVRRRLTYGALAGALGGVCAFAFNMFAAQSAVCGAPVPFLQPTLADACGAVGLGDKPTRAERLAWADREPGSCEALRDHVEAYPDGAYRAAAADLLAARSVRREDVWSPSERRLALFIPRGERQDGEAAAQADALERAAPHADRLCQGFASTTLFRLNSAAAEAQVWDCADGMCGFDGEAVCSLEVREAVEIEECREATRGP